MGETLQFMPPESTDAEQAYQCIQHAIATRRDGLIADYQSGKFGSTFATYEDELDRAVYGTLKGFQGSNQEALQRAKQELDADTILQLQTHIGERLHAGFSTYKFRIEDGELKSEKTGVSIVPMIDRGRQARNAQVDKGLKEGKISPHVAEQIKQRHDAEVDQFKEIRKKMTDSQMKIGTTMISISPSGSGYADNFYDVFVLKEDVAGTKYVEAKRYASALDAEKSLEQVQALQKGYGEDRGSMSLIPYFLAHPIIVDNPLHTLFNNPDGIHAFMQQDKNSMTEADFTLIKEVIAGIISVYLQEVFDHPDDADRHAEILDAMKNKADEVADVIKIPHEQSARIILRRDNPVLIGIYDFRKQTYAAAIADISRLGSEPVRVAITGCGESGSSRKRQGGLGALMSGGINELILPGNMSSFSLLDDMLNQDDPDGKGPLEFECDKCNGKHTRPLGELLPACPTTGESYEQCG